MCGERNNNISAREDLKNVSVSANGREICRFDKIKKGSEEVCHLDRETLNETRVFVVSAGEIKKAVVCYQPVKPVPVGGG